MPLATKIGFQRLKKYRKDHFALRITLVTKGSSAASTVFRWGPSSTSRLQEAASSNFPLVRSEILRASDRQMWHNVYAKFHESRPSQMKFVNGQVGGGQRNDNGVMISVNDFKRVRRWYYTG